MKESDPIFVIASVTPDAVSSAQTGTTVCMLKLLNALLELGPVTLFAPSKPLGPISHPDRLSIRPVTHAPPGKFARAWLSFRDGVVPSMWADQSPEVLNFLHSNEPGSFRAGVLLDEYTAIYMSSFPTSVPMLFIRHNLFSRSWSHYGSGMINGLRSRYFHWLSKRFDRWTTVAADAVLAGTQQSVDTLKEINPSTPGFLLATTSVWQAPTSRAKTTAPLADGKKVAVFLGNFDYEPNAAAVLWFTQQVLPLIDPAVRSRWVYRFIGKNAPKEAAGPSVELAGFADDLDTELGAATAAFIPLRSGNGVKLKTLTLLGAGLPTVTTSQGAEGLPVTDGVDCLIADDPTAFARAMERLEDPELRNKLGPAAAAAIDSYNRQSGSAEVFRAALNAVKQASRSSKPRRAPDMPAVATAGSVG